MAIRTIERIPIDIQNNLDTEINAVKNLIKNCNEQIDTVDKKLDESNEQIAENDKKTTERYIENKTAINDTKMKMSQLSNYITTEMLKTEIFELKTHINILKFISIIEAIVIAGGIIGYLS